MTVRPSRGPTMGTMPVTDMAARQGAVNAAMAATEALEATEPVGGTLASLGAASAVPVGTRRYITDANVPDFLSVAVGSGADFSPVISDGVDWRCG